MVLCELPGYAVSDYNIEGKAVMPKQFSEAVYAGGFHFEIADTVIADIKPRKSGNQVGLGQAYAEDATLRTVKAGAGNRNAMMITFNKVFDKRRRAAGYIGEGDVACYLRLSDECLEDLVFFMGGFVTVEVEQVVDTKPVCGCYQAINRNIILK